MRFLKFHTLRLNLDRLNWYTYDSEEEELTLYFSGGASAIHSFEGDFAKDLLTRLDEAIGADSITDTVANAAAQALLASFLAEEKVSIDG